MIQSCKWDNRIEGNLILKDGAQKMLNFKRPNLKKNQVNLQNLQSKRWDHDRQI